MNRFEKQIRTVMSGNKKRPVMTIAIQWLDAGKKHKCFSRSPSSSSVSVSHERFNHFEYYNHRDELEKRTENDAPQIDTKDILFTNIY